MFIFSSFEHDLEINDVGPSKTFICLQTWVLQINSSALKHHVLKVTSDYHGFDCYRYKEYGKNMGDRLSRSWLLEMVPNSLRPREIVGKKGIRKNVRNVFTYHWWTRQTSISAFFIIQQVNFILSLYDHRRFMDLDWTWVSICTYNILWNRERIE